MVVNPSSKPRWVKKYLGEVIDVLKKGGFQIQVIKTQREGEATSIVRKTPYELIIVGGGDGTINEVINGTTNLPVTLGIIPLGTSNVLARALRIPLDPIKAAELIVEGGRRKCDLGRVGERYFLIMVGCGFDAYAIMKTSLRAKRFIGRYAYVMAGLTHLLDYKPGKISLRFDDGQTQDTGTFVVVGNAHLYGGDYQITPQAKIDDGFLDACVFKGERLPSLLYFAMRVVRRKPLTYPEVRYYRFKKASLEADRLTFFQTDGDLAGQLPTQIEIIPGAINIIC